MQGAAERGAAAADILVIEDDADVSSALASVLRDEGYAVEQATDGRHALDYLHRAPAPALILLDLMMPALDGFGFRAEQLRDERLAAIPVLVLTAGALDERARALATAGCLRKPVQLDSLLAEVARLAGPPRAA